MARKKRRTLAEMNVVPYIDVMLVLLVIFMVTAPMLKQGVEVDLPNAASDTVSSKDDVQPLIVSLDSRGLLYLNQSDESDVPQSLPDIQNSVAQTLNKQPDTPVLVKADEYISYGKVIELMSALKAGGAPKVGLLTEMPQKAN